MNVVLANLGLNVTIDAPRTADTEAYRPQMLSEHGAAYPVSELSSGERIILNLALCGYHLTSQLENVQAPKLVLLDEVDAPLHPAMVKTYLDVITDVMVGQFGMTVIATTHSPSTVALFPHDSVYVMKKGVAGPQSLGKELAVAELSAGVPTLAVSLENRRQVFAESPIEAANFERLYGILRERLASPISLQFIATGTKESNSSRDIVLRIVGELEAAGNRTVYGIIDWDGKNVSSGRVKVLAEGRRYGLENLLLDPLIVALYLLRHYPSAASHYGLEASLKFTELASLQEAVAQPAVSAVTNKVLGHAPADLTTSRYQSGLCLQVDGAYLAMAAHSLEVAVAKAFPVLESAVHRGSGQLTRMMIDDVLEEIPGVMPVEIEETFRTLLV